MEPLLNPVAVDALVEKLTEAEAAELAAYAIAGGSAEQYLVRVSEWLRKRFRLTGEQN